MRIIYVQGVIMVKENTYLLDRCIRVKNRFSRLVSLNESSVKFCLLVDYRWHEKKKKSKQSKYSDLISDKTSKL